MIHPTRALPPSKPKPTPFHPAHTCLLCSRLTDGTQTPGMLPLFFFFWSFSNICSTTWGPKSSSSPEF